MNRVILMGRLTRDPDIRYGGANNTAIARLSLAVSRRFKRDGEPDCDFINCVAFGKTAEFIEKWCVKGTKLIVEGRWQTGSFTNKDGNKVYTNDCMIEQCEFAESKQTAENNNAERPQTMPDSDGFMNIPDGIDDSELPFS